MEDLQDVERGQNLGIVRLWGSRLWTTRMAVAGVG
jgi:hypothetical protein